MITATDIAAANWIPLLELNGHRFYQCRQWPDLYRREKLGELMAVRWACDDVVCTTLSDVARRLNASRETQAGVR